jgi:hypothetical protein
MSIRPRAEKAAQAILGVLGADASAEQTAAVVKAIEAAMIDAYRDCSERNAKAALAVCEEDLDKAHKIADEIRRANVALVANLSSMR